MIRTPAPTVWIVDDDLGFVWWLGELLTEAGCRTLPALSCSDAVALINKLGLPPDLLILNSYLPGTGALVRRLQPPRARTKFVTIGAPQPALLNLARIESTLERPSGVEPISRAEWRKKIRRLLSDVRLARATG